MRSRLGVAILLVAAFILGIGSGAILQRYYGLRNLFIIASKSGRIALLTLGKPTRTLGEINDHIPEEFQGRLSLFILAGQSNMSGHGELPSAQSFDPKVFTFGNDYRWRVAREPIDAADGQVDEVSRDNEAGVGPGLAFATALVAHYPDTGIGLIPCAKGASAIEEWQRHLSDNTLYGSCLKRIRAATTMGSIAGLLFFQGEADAIDPLRHPEQSLSPFDYATKFSTFVNDLRHDLTLPYLPVVFAQIGSHAAPGVFVNWNIVQEQQQRTDLPCATMIVTNDLALKDTVHFTTESYRIIGQRYAEALLELKTQTPHCG
jgi:hypothetical protein